MTAGEGGPLCVCAGSMRLQVIAGNLNVYLQPILSVRVFSAVFLLAFRHIWLY